MILEMKVPSPGESITEVEIASWLVEDGDYVEFVEADISSWLSSNQKKIIKENKGCVKVTFYGSTYTPETEKDDAFFSPGEIAFESSFSCD